MITYTESVGFMVIFSEVHWFYEIKNFSFQW